MNAPNITLDSDGIDLITRLYTRSAGTIEIFHSKISAMADGKKWDVLEQIRKSARQLAEELSLPLNETANFRRIAEEIDGEEER